jgi:hypothetical protein
MGVRFGPVFSVRFVFDVFCSLAGLGEGVEEGRWGWNDVAREGEVLFVVCEIRNLGCRRGMVAGLSSYCFALLFSF